MASSSFSSSLRDIDLDTVDSSSTKSLPSSSFRSSISFSLYPNDFENSIHTLKYLGIPFSWEKQPGIPKKSTLSRSKIKDNPLIMLPLPPAAGNSKKFNLETIFAFRKKTNLTSEKNLEIDPFVAALMECSKDNYKEVDDLVNDNYGKNNENKVVTKSLSDKFRFVDRYASCKRSCAVLESKILVPRSNQTMYDRLSNRRSR